jgi:hypothetical protein
MPIPMPTATSPEARTPARIRVVHRPVRCKTPRAPAPAVLERGAERDDGAPPERQDGGQEDEHADDREDLADRTGPPSAKTSSSRSLFGKTSMKLGPASHTRSPPSAFQRG